MQARRINSVQEPGCKWYTVHVLHEIHDNKAYLTSGTLYSYRFQRLQHGNPDIVLIMLLETTAIELTVYGLFHDNLEIFDIRA